MDSMMVVDTEVCGLAAFAFQKLLTTYVVSVVLNISGSVAHVYAARRHGVFKDGVEV